MLGPDGAGFSSMAKAQTASSARARRLDVAQLLTTIASECGAAAAVAALRDGDQPEHEALIADPAADRAGVVGTTLRDRRTKSGW